LRSYHDLPAIHLVGKMPRGERKYDYGNRSDKANEAEREG
jgi:hypothetical protein